MELFLNGILTGRGRNRQLGDSKHLVWKIDVKAVKIISDEIYLLFYFFFFFMAYIDYSV
jgi:hypothetical protein